MVYFAISDSIHLFLLRAAVATKFFLFSVKSEKSATELQKSILKVFHSEREVLFQATSGINLNGLMTSQPRLYITHNEENFLSATKKKSRVVLYEVIKLATLARQCINLLKNNVFVSYRGSLKRERLMNGRNLSCREASKVIPKITLPRPDQCMRTASANIYF